MTLKFLAHSPNKGTNLLSKDPLVELLGQNRVLIENHKGVLSYLPEEVQIKVAYGILIVTGHKLKLMRLNCDQIVVLGQIKTICPNGGKI